MTLEQNWNPQAVIDELIKRVKNRRGQFPSDFATGYDAAQDTVLEIIEEGGGFTQTRS